MNKRPWEVRIGVIGCGDIAQSVHLPILKKLGGARVVALCDVDSFQLNRANQFISNASCFQDYHELLALADVDAVIICTPSQTHAQIAIATAIADKHVYLEKPIATHLRDAQDVIKAWQGKNRVAMLGFNFRSNPLYQQARKYIHDGLIGPVVSIRSVFSTVSHSRPRWAEIPGEGGGALLELASHDIDLIRFMCGREITAVFADIRNINSQGDTAVLQMQLDNGTTVQSQFSISCIEEASLEIYGQNGKISLDRYRSLYARLTQPVTGGVWGQFLDQLREFAHLSFLWKKLTSPANEPSYVYALTLFIECVRHNTPTSPDFKDGFQSLAVIAAAEESFQKNRPIAPVQLEDFHIATSSAVNG